MTKADSEAIRRRVNRQYVAVLAPACLDVASVAELVAVLADTAVDVDLVIDTSAVEVVTADAIDVLAAAAHRALPDSTVTLNKPTRAVEDALHQHSESDLKVQRHRNRRY